MSNFGEMNLQERYEKLWDDLSAARRTISALQDIVLDLTGEVGRLTACLDAQQEHKADTNKETAMETRWYARFLGTIYNGEIVAPNGDEYSVEDADKALELVRLLNEREALRRQARDVVRLVNEREALREQAQKWECRARELESLCSDRL